MKAKVIGFVGYSNSGKTTIASYIVGKLKEDGFRSCVIKHDAHGHYKDYGDTSQYREAGAETVILASPLGRFVYSKGASDNLQDILLEMENDQDYIIVEGFKEANHPKIVIVRYEDQLELLQTNMLSVRAIVAVEKYSNFENIKENIPILQWNDWEAVYRFIRGENWEYSVE